MDLFRCDKCGHTGPMSEKRGRLILQELGPEAMPHPARFNAKAEVCEKCFQELKRGIQQTVSKPSVTQVQGIMAEASLAVLDMNTKKKG